MQSIVDILNYRIILKSNIVAIEMCYVEFLHDFQVKLQRNSVLQDYQMRIAST